jgi:biopolymer transport protein ExbD
MKLRKKRKSDAIPVAAMGDIAFLLLIFYMSTTMLTDQKPLDLPLPAVEGQSQVSPYPLIIYMNRELAGREQVYFYNERHPISDLATLVQARAAESPAAVRVYVNMEKDLPYRYLNAVIQELKEAGIRSMIITTQASDETIPGRTETAP